MTAAEFVQLVTAAGPAGVMALWLFTERKERLRLQRVVESFLPLIAGTHRAMSSVTRVVSPHGGESDDTDA